MAEFKKGVQPDGSWLIYAGDRNRVLWRFKAGGIDWDLSGAEIEVHAKKKDTDPVPALIAAVEMTAAIAGQVAISWDGEEVRTLLAGKSAWQGEFDIQVLQPGQTLPDTIHRAKIIAQMDIT